MWFTWNSSQLIVLLLVGTCIEAFVAPLWCPRNIGEKCCRWWYNGDGSWACSQRKYLRCCGGWTPTSSSRSDIVQTEFQPIKIDLPDWLKDLKECVTAILQDMTKTPPACCKVPILGQLLKSCQKPSRADYPSGGGDQSGASGASLVSEPAQPVE